MPAIPDTDDPAEETPSELIVPHRYSHVTKAIFERPWAMQPAMLAMIGNLLKLRSSGDALTEEAIRKRLAAAAAQNGDRNGPAIVNGVAVIPLYGMISQRQSLMSDTSGGTSLDEIRGNLRDALANPKVSSVVFDIDSPGGSVDGVTEFAAEIRKARSGSKPIVAQVDTMAASAAYWLAAQMNEIVVTPSGSVGSIGVFAMHEDVSKAADMAGVKTTLISAGKFKTDGNQFAPLTDTARAAIQDQVDAFYHMFVADVAKGRSVSIDTVDSEYGQGRELLAKQALAVGMVDRIDTLEATVGRLAARPARRVALASLSSKQAAIAATARHGPDLSALIAKAIGQPDTTWQQLLERTGRK